MAGWKKINEFRWQRTISDTRIDLYKRGNDWYVGCEDLCVERRLRDSDGDPIQTDELAKTMAIAEIQAFAISDMEDLQQLINECDKSLRGGR